MKSHNSIIILFLTLTLFSINSCSFIGLFNSDSEKTNQVKINFDYTPSGENQPTEIYVYNSKGNKPNVYPLKEGDNSITVERKSVSLISFTKSPVSSRKIKNGTNFRSISDSVSTIGNLNVVAADLNSIPVSENAENSINLGNVEQNQSNFNTDVDLDKISAETGNTSQFLSNIGEYDPLMMKYANPDINRNGRYDVEEEFNWEFYVRYVYNIPSSKIDYNSMSFHEVFEQDDPERLVWYFKYKDAPQNFNPEQLHLPDDAPRNIVERNGSTSGGDKIIHFTATNELVKNNGPYDGNYSIDQDFFISNVNFIKPGDDYDGMLVPLIHMEPTENDTIKTMEIKWWVLDEGVFRLPYEGEVEFKVNRLIVSTKTSSSMHPVVFWQFDKETYLNTYPEVYVDDEFGINLETNPDSNTDFTTLWWSYNYEDPYYTFFDLYRENTHELDFKAIDLGFSKYENGKVNVSELDYPFSGGALARYTDISGNQFIFAYNYMTSEDNPPNIDIYYKGEDESSVIVDTGSPEEFLFDADDDIGISELYIEDTTIGEWKTLQEGMDLSFLSSNPEDQFSYNNSESTITCNFASDMRSVRQIGLHLKAVDTSGQEDTSWIEITID